MTQEEVLFGDALGQISREAQDRRYERTVQAWLRGKPEFRRSWIEHMKREAEKGLPLAVLVTQRVILLKLRS